MPVIVMSWNGKLRRMSMAETIERGGTKETNFLQKRSSRFSTYTTHKAVWPCGWPVTAILMTYDIAIRNPKVGPDDRAWVSWRFARFAFCKLPLCLRLFVVNRPSASDSQYVLVSLAFFSEFRQLLHYAPKSLSNTS